MSKKNYRNKYIIIILCLQNHMYIIMWPPPEFEYAQLLKSMLSRKRLGHYRVGLSA